MLWIEEGSERLKAFQRQCGILGRADSGKNANGYIWDNKMAIFVEKNLH